MKKLIAGLIDVAIPVYRAHGKRTRVNSWTSAVSP